MYRCAAVHLWTAEDLAAVAPKRLFDVRGLAEAERFPVTVHDERFVSLPCPPVQPSGRPRDLPTLTESYLAIARFSGPSIVSMFESLCDPDELPAVIFCAAGKDRTGVASALLLGALEVDDDQIVEDYARSGTLDPRSLGDGYADYYAHLPEEYLGSEPGTMRAVVDTLIKEHGSLRAFVASLGFERFEDLEAALLEP